MQHSVTLHVAINIVQIVGYHTRNEDFWYRIGTFVAFCGEKAVRDCSGGIKGLAPLAVQDREI